MTGDKEKGFDFGTLGIIIAIFIIIISVVWITVVNLHNDDNPNEVTWVG